jgi:hypothetical protein
MTISTASHAPLKCRPAVAGFDEDRPDAEFETLLPRQPASETRGRWFDLCFRLIILALAALWLLTPPVSNERVAAEEKASATTR